MSDILPFLFLAGISNRNLALEVLLIKWKAQTSERPRISLQSELIVPKYLVQPFVTSAWGACINRSSRQVTLRV